MNPIILAFLVHLGCLLHASIFDCRERSVSGFGMLCDATLLFATRSKLNNELLPHLRKEVANDIHMGLKSVKGVAVSFEY